MKKYMLLLSAAFLACFWVYFNRPAAEAPPETAGTPEKRRPPLSADLTSQTENGRDGWLVTFNRDLVLDKELLFKNLTADERPFQTSAALPLKVFWKEKNVLRIEPEASPLEVEAALNEAPWLWRWKKDLQNLPDWQPPNFVSGQAYPLYIANKGAGGDGQLLTEIGLVPFRVKIKSNIGPSETPALTFAFNRSMVKDDQVNRPLKPEDAPFILTPALPNLKINWRDRRTLTLEAPMTRADFWEKVSDRPFRLAWKPGFKNLFGQAAPDLNKAEFLDFPEASATALYFSKFAAVGLNQAGLDIDGRASFDLVFNKPVRLDEVKKRLKVKIRDMGRESSGYQEAPAEVLGIGGAGDEAGTTARFSLQGRPGERIAVSVAGLKSADGRGLAEQPALESWVDDFFTIESAKLETEDKYPWKSYFAIKVTEAVNFGEIEKYIELEPPLEFTVHPSGEEGNVIQVFAAFTSSPTRVTLRKGMPSRKGMLTKEASYQVSLPDDLGRKLMFTGRGRYLSPEKPLLVKLAGRNVEAVRLQAWRIHEDNLPTLINVQDYGPSTRARLALQFNKNILNRTTKVQAASGEVFERLVDLKEVLEVEPFGAYLLKISPAKKDESRAGSAGEADDDGLYSYSDYYSYPERFLPVMISDLGLAAHVSPGRMTLWVNSLSQAKPVEGGTVKLYDEANQVVAQGQTGQDGLFSAGLDVSKAVFATVEKDGDLNYLLLGARRSSYAGEDYDYYLDPREDADAKWYGGHSGYFDPGATESAGPGRPYLARGYEAFLFLPRDMFKPGETVRVKAMIRDKNLLPPEKQFPVLWRINDPDGRAISQGRADLNPFGGADFAAEIPFSARTGAWIAEMYLPGSTEKLGQAGFTVEDFTPPRLAIELAADPKVYKGENPEMTVKAEVRYLFGAPGAELNWELDAEIVPADFKPAGWEGFEFPGPSSDFQATSQRRAARGRLDAGGQADISYQPNLNSELLPAKMAVLFTVSAQEDGGRWNAKRVKVDYFPRELILGYKPPDSPAVKKPFRFEVAAIDTEGSPAAPRRLKVSISQVLAQYYSSYRYGRRYRHKTEELKLKTETRVGLARGRASLDFTPEIAGEYQIEIAEPVSGQSITRRVQVHGLETAEASPPKGVVELAFDRETYRPGDTAAVKVRSPFPGRLWLTVETDSLLHSTVLDMETAEARVVIPVAESLKTNAMVTATVVRPLAEGETGYRALGVKSLEIDRDLYKLNVALDMPNRVKPSAPATLKIKITDSEGRPAAGEATVALVDEGVLSLSSFKTPDPWRMFTAGRRMLTRFYDLYEELLPVEKAAVPFLIPGGGDGLGRSGLFSPFKRKQEILSIFLASLTVDENGETVVDLDLPEYSGQGRLMVVASSRDRFGSASQDIAISRDLTSEATLPLALAPGDSFEIPVRVFAAAEAPAETGRGASISLRTEGPLRLLESRAEFNLKPGQGETKIFKAAAEPSAPEGDQAGLGRLIIESRSGLGEHFTQAFEVAVRPPYPRVAAAYSAQTKEAETAINIPAEGYLRGTVEASLTLAKSPAIEAARAVGFLREYPYGCLEQTASKAWMFVAADDLLAGAALTESQDGHIAQGLNAAVKRLATMQTQSGGFATWPGGQEVYEWGSVYAAHFLTEAAPKTELPPGLLERTLKWLKAFLGSGYNSSSDEAAYILAARAYAVYVLALNGEYRQAWVNALKDRYDGLSPSARIFLAGAEALNSGHSGPLEILDKNPADWSANTLNQRISSLESAPRNQALKLLVWAQVDPLSETTNKLAWQVAEAGRAGLWGNTQENGLAVLALGAYLGKSASGQPYKAVLTAADGRPLFTAGPNEVAVAGPQALAPVQGQPLKLSLEGEGRPYYTLTVGGVPRAAPAPKAHKLKLARTWVMEDGRKAPLSTPDEVKESLKVAKGDRVIVEIEVDAAEALQNLVLVDLLPGGFEIENPRLVPAAENQGRGDEKEDGEGTPTARLELREDRLVIIEPWVNPGLTAYRYTLRAITSGEYTLPATVAEGMYEPDRQAILPTGQVRVTAR